MDKYDFLGKIFVLYGKSLENKSNAGLLEQYSNELGDVPFKVDWQAYYKYLETTSDKEYQTMPSLKQLKAKLSFFKSADVGQYRYDSGKGVLRLKDRFYIYDMWHITRTIDEIYRYYRSKYGDNFVSFKYYPEDFTIIGRRIYRWLNNKQELYEEI